MKMKILITSICIAMACGSYYLGNYLGERDGFNNAYKSSSKKLLDNAQYRVIDFSNTTLELDNQKILEQLFISSKTDSAEIVFSNILSQVHHEILEKVYLHANLPEDVSNQLLSFYDSIHVGIADQYYTVFNAKRSESMTNTEPYFYRNAYDLGEQFGQTVSEGICDLMLTLGTLATITKSFSLTDVIKEVLVAGICSSVLNSIFPELRKDLREAGLYYDMQSIEMVFDEHFRKSIAEIATVQDIIPEIESKRVKTKKWWIFESKAELTVFSNARVKAGVDAMKYFAYRVDPNTKILTVQVAEPKILSVEIDSKVVDLDNGVFSKIDPKMHNSIKNSVEIEVNKAVEKRNILNDAKLHFEDFFEAIVSPTLQFRGIEGIKFEYIEANQISSTILKG